MKALKPLAALLLGVVSACGDRSGSATDTAGRSAAGAEAASAAATAARADAELERAARQVVAFLRAESSFDSLALVDTVELRVAPEGGGAVRRVSRDALRDREAWTVAAGTGRRLPLVPPAAYSTLVTRVNRHLNCGEQDLATREPDLASHPHVGVLLQPDGAQSCLQSWNATLVFDTTGGRPRLTAVVYDQWEW